MKGRPAKRPNNSPARGEAALQIELHASRQMLQLVLDNIPQRIFWKDLNGVYLGCNRTFAFDAGLKRPEDIVGKNDYDLPWKKEEADFYRTCDRRVMENDKPELSIYEPQLTANGTEAWVRTNKVPLHDPHGKVIGILGTYEDITEKKLAEEALRESEEKYRTLVESAADAIFLADLETGYLVDANRKAEELTGLARGKIIGLHYTQLHPQGESRYYRDLFRIHTQQDPDFMSTGFVMHKSGRKIPVHISGALCELNGRKVIIGIFRDITQLKMIEDELRRDKNGLQKMVGETREILESTQKELDDARRLSEIGALAATVAHELRNPLGVIRAALYNIKQKRVDAGLDKHIANIDKKIGESEKIVRELLNYAQIKMPRYKEVPLLKVLEECVGHCRHKYVRHSVKVRMIKPKVTGAAFIEADPGHVSQIFMNILDNAYQAFPKQKGKIDVRLNYDKESRQYGVSFRDNGEGISRENLSRIFDPFFTTKVKGTGLGLSVCSQLVNLYGGKIHIKSQKGRGATVSVTLPSHRKK